MAQARTYDLLERTAKFGEAVVLFAKKVPKTTENLPLIRQLVKAGTSVGANNCEANDAVSRRDFRCKVGICRKESSETKYWLRLIGVAEPRLREEARRLWEEAHELHLIFAKSFQTAGKDKAD
ncbi:MAG: four helix bundle protein [Planctomycetes bacterium]|nr:four helix bundle protein [Planctomycetota bacterium]